MLEMYISHFIFLISSDLDILVTRDKFPRLIPSKPILGHLMVGLTLYSCTEHLFAVYSFSPALLSAIDYE